MADTGGPERRSVALAPRAAALARRPEGVSAPGPGSRIRVLRRPVAVRFFATAEGITVYPPRAEGDRWRAVWYEPDGQRGQCQAVTEGRLTARLEPVAERLAAQAPNTQRTGRELIAHYLSPDRLPPERPVVAQARRDAAVPVRPVHRARHRPPRLPGHQNGSPAVGRERRADGLARAAACGRSSAALAGDGMMGGYLTSARLKDVHWQVRTDARSLRRAVRWRGRACCPSTRGTMPGPGDVAALGQAVAAARGVAASELMVDPSPPTAACAGASWPRSPPLRSTRGSELVAVDRKVVEIRASSLWSRRSAASAAAPDLPAPHPGRVAAGRTRRPPDRRHRARAGGRA